MKYVRLLLVLLALGCGGSSLLVQALANTPDEPAATPSEQFPILSRFDLPRTYGYFIGDEIPVTLVLETSGNVVLDLINLPQPGEKFGPFEIRTLQLSSTTLPAGTKIYRAAYTLQYFGPTPMTTLFGPLEILYAFPPDRKLQESTYTYQRLLTQPAVIHMARLGPRQALPPVHIKGHVDDARLGLIRVFFILGTVLVLGAVGSLGWEGFTTWQRHRASASPRSAIEQTLQTLRHEASVLFRAPAAPTSLVAARLDHILREYVQTAYDVSASTLTTPELAAQLSSTPHTPDILRLLEQCEALRYQPASAPSAVGQELWQDTITLFEKLQEGLRS